MSILIDSETRVLIQGITGKLASAVARDLRSYGTAVVGGVVPDRGGVDHEGVPVFDTVREAVDAVRPNASLTFVPPSRARSAIDEAIDAGVPLVVYPGDGLPVLDAVALRAKAAERGTLIVGPNSPGLISPGRSKVGFMPSYCYRPGQVGVISKSGSLSYEVCLRLSELGVGQSTVLGIGGDNVKGTTMAHALELFHLDPETVGVLVLGEIGGLDEYAIASYAQTGDPKPVVAYLTGRSAPPGRKLGHAASLVKGRREGYAAKVAALRDAGVPVATSLVAVASLAQRELR